MSDDILFSKLVDSFICGTLVSYKPYCKAIPTHLLSKYIFHKEDVELTSVPHTLLPF